MPAPLAMPITVLLVSFGLLTWTDGLFFLGIGAAPAKEGAPHPAKTVALVNMIGAIAIWIQVYQIIGGQTLGAASNPVAGVGAMFAFLFLLLGFVLWYGLDLKPVGNLAFVVGVVTIFYMIWWFSLGALMFTSIAIVWWIACFLTTAVTYGKAPAKYAGGWLLVVAWWTFLIPTLMIVFGIAIP